MNYFLCASAPAARSVGGVRTSIAGGVRTTACRTASRRKIALEALNTMDLSYSDPDGAFYVYFDVSVPRVGRAGEFCEAGMSAKMHVSSTRRDRGSPPPALHVSLVVRWLPGVTCTRG